MSLPDPNKAKRLRVAAKGWVAGSVTQVTRILEEKPTLTQEEFKLVIEELRSRLVSLQEHILMGHVNIIQKGRAYTRDVQELETQHTFSYQQHITNTRWQTRRSKKRW